MKEGDVVLTPLAQADGQVKNRPCIALRRLPGFGDTPAEAQARFLSPY